RRALPETVLSEIGRLDPAAIAQVREEAWPDVRDADELNEALQVFVALPETFGPPHGATVAAQWGELFRQLVTQNRAARAVMSGTNFWLAAEKMKTFSILFPGARFETQPAEIN